MKINLIKLRRNSINIKINININNHFFSLRISINKFSEEVILKGIQIYVYH